MTSNSPKRRPREGRPGPVRRSRRARGERQPVAGSRGAGDRARAGGDLVLRPAVRDDGERDACPCRRRGPRDGDGRDPALHRRARLRDGDQPDDRGRSDPRRRRGGDRERLLRGTRVRRVRRDEQRLLHGLPPADLDRRPPDRDRTPGDAFDAEPPRDEGRGEGGAIPVAAAFAQAVEDALADIAPGLEILDIPCSPGRLFELLRKLREGSTQAGETA